MKDVDWTIYLSEETKPVIIPTLLILYEYGSSFTVSVDFKLEDGQNISFEKNDMDDMIKWMPKDLAIPLIELFRWPILARSAGNNRLDQIIGGIIAKHLSENSRVVVDDQGVYLYLNDHLLAQLDQVVIRTPDGQEEVDSSNLVGSVAIEYLQRLIDDN